MVQQQLLKHQTTAASRVAVRSLATDLGVSYTTALRYLQATAELAARSQQLQLNRVTEYLWRQTEAGFAKPIVYIYRHAYDETKLRVRVRLPELAHIGAAHGKIFVLQCSWTMLFQSRTLDSDWQYMSVSASCSPCLRITDSTRAECVAAVMASAPQMLNDRIKELFPAIYKISETDEAKANSRAEKLWSRANPSTSATLHMCCVAHKIHALADKSWSLDKVLLSQVTRVLLALQSAEEVAQLKKAMNIIVA